MGNKESKIATNNINKQSLQSIIDQSPQEYKPSHLTFGQFYKNNKPDHNKYKISILSPIKQQITVKIKAFKDRNEAYETKTKNIQIQSSLFDRQIKDRYVFQTSANGQERSLSIRTFKNVQSKTFAGILYEIHISQQISRLDSKNLHKIMDKYMIPLDIKGQKHPNSIILQMQRIDINLSKIITFRRQNNIQWDQKQFAKLINDLIQGLEILHRNNIVHNAIRPDNIYFSSKTNQFMLGSFFNCIKVGQSGKRQIVNNDQLHPQHIPYDIEEQKRKDIGDLGKALLSAFYLCYPIDVKKAEQHNQYFYRKHDSLKIVLQMINPQKNKKTAEYLRSAMTVSSFQYSEMKDIVKKMYGKSKEINRAVGWGYLHLGKYEQMEQSNNDLSRQHETNNNTLEKAQHYQHLASVQKDLGKTQDSKRYGKLASKHYNEVGNQNFNNKNYIQAEKNYKKSIKCLSKYNNGEYDQILRQNIQQLQKIQHINNPNNYLQIKKLSNANSRITSKLRGDSLDTCEAKAKQAMLDSQHGAFQSSQKLYNECLEILGRNNQETAEDRRLIKAILLTQKAQNNLRWAQNQDCQIKRANYLQSTENDLRQSLIIYEQYGQRNPNDKTKDSFKDQISRIHLYKLLGQLNFKQEEYENSVNQYNKGIKLSQYVQSLTQKPLKQKGDLLCGRGTSQSFLGNSEEAVKDYQLALDLYAKVYGSNNNAASAIAIGNLGRVYINQGEQQKAKACLHAGQKILRQVNGQQDPDYIHFKLVQKNFEQYRYTQVHQ